MKKYILLFLVLTSVSSAQFPMLAAWNDAGFSPQQIDTLQAWYKADALLESDGDTLYLWQNSASTGITHNLYQTADSKKPTYSATGAYGNPAVVFDGVDDDLATANITGPVDYTHGTTFIVMLQRAGTANNQVIAWLASGAQTTNLYASYLTFTNQYYYDHGAESTGRINATQIASWDDRWHIVELRRNADTMQLWTGDTLRIHRTGKTAGYAAATSQPLRIGSRISGSLFGGSIAEIIIYRNAISFADRAKVVAYLKQKYSLP